MLYEVITSGILREKSEAGRKFFSVSYDKMHIEIPVGKQILIDDGETAMTVVEREADYVLCRIENKGKIKNKKSVNTPGFTVDLPSILASVGS